MKTNSQSEILVLMYHHIHGPEAGHLAGLYGVEKETFRAQLRSINRSHPIISYPELAAGLEGRTNLPERCALITFDDGTIDHYRCAFPVLRQEGHTAVFFVITGAVTQGTLTQVHMRHLLDRQLGKQELQKAFLEHYQASGGSLDDFDRFPQEVVRTAYRWDDPKTAAFKYAVNFGIPAKVRNRILRDLVCKHLQDFETLGRNFYLNWDQVAEMAEAGMTMGGHTHSHEALSLMEPEAMKTDLRRCKGELDQRLGHAATAFSYPYGKAQHFDQTVIDTLSQLGFTDSFANIQGINHFNAQGLEPGRFHWRRIDPKDLPTVL